jgi:hypothetical protein
MGFRPLKTRNARNLILRWLDTCVYERGSEAIRNKIGEPLRYLDAIRSRGAQPRAITAG